MLKDLVKSFKENGFVTVPDVFSSSEIEFYREVIKRHLYPEASGFL